MRDLFSTLSRAGRQLTNLAPVPYTRRAESRSLFNQAPEGLPVGERAYDAYGSVGTLFAIVKQIQEAVAATEWHLYRKGPKRDKTRRTEVMSHGFLDVWNMPNEFQTGFMLREAVQQHLDLVGEGFIVLNTIGGLVLEMWSVRPDRMHPVKHPTKFLTGWIYHGPDGEKVPLTVDQVVQIKYPNPADPYRGMGPVQTVLNDIDAAKYSAEWNKNFFINGAKPGGIITVDYRMGDDEFNAFVARWRKQHQGVANAHRVAVLENAKWQDTQFSMSDMQFVELRNLPRELVREAFAFPKPMLGTVDDVNRANAEAGKTIMAENQTIPRLGRWKDVTNAFLLPRFANGKALEHDFDDPTPIDHEAADRERLSKANSANKLVMSGFHPDDVSDAMELPRMRWIGLPAAQAPEESDTEDQDQDQATEDQPKKTAKPVKK